MLNPFKSQRVGKLVAARRLGKPRVVVGGYNRCSFCLGVIIKCRSNESCMLSFIRQIERLRFCMTARWRRILLPFCRLINILLRDSDANCRVTRSDHCEDRRNKQQNGPETIIVSRSSREPNVPGRAVKHAESRKIFVDDQTNIASHYIVDRSGHTYLLAVWSKREFISQYWTCLIAGNNIDLTHTMA